MLCVLNDAVRRVHAFGRERQEEVLAHLQTALFQHGQDEFVGRSRIGGGLEDDELPRAEALGDLLRRRHDVGHVGVFGLAQRRGDTDVDGVHLPQDVEVRRRPEPFGRHELRHLCGRHVVDVGPALVYGIYLIRVEIDARAGEPGPAKLDHQGQTHVPRPITPVFARRARINSSSVAAVADRTMREKSSGEADPSCPVVGQSQDPRQPDSPAALAI